MTTLFPVVRSNSLASTSSTELKPRPLATLISAAFASVALQRRGSINQTVRAGLMDLPRIASLVCWAKILHSVYCCCFAFQRINRLTLGGATTSEDRPTMIATGQSLYGSERVYFFRFASP